MPSPGGLTLDMRHAHGPAGLKLASIRPILPLMLRPKHYTRPSRSRDAAAAFWTVLRQVALVSGSMHLLMAALFAWFGVPSMAWVNVGSVALFALSYVCLHFRANYLAVVLTLLEIMVHAILAVFALGWDSGFHYYLLVVVPVVMISQALRLRQKLTIIVGLLLTYVSLDFAAHHTPPWHPLSPIALSGWRLFNTVMTFVLLTYLSHMYLRAILKAARQLRALATTDPLTQLANRRSLLEIAEHEVQAAHQSGGPLALILADIDHFKAINDIHGHAAGDAMLARVSEVLKQAVRGHDTVSRWGGEEFLILMPQASQDTAKAVAERLREQVAAIDIQVGQRSVKTTMTFGVSSLQPQETLDQAVARADMALYSGKVGGRNQVVTAAA